MRSPVKLAALSFLLAAAVFTPVFVLGTFAMRGPLADRGDRVEVSSALAQLDLPQLTQLSDAVVDGTVLSVGPAVAITDPLSGERLAYTPWRVQVGQTLKGDPAGAEVTLPTLGGTVDGLAVMAHDEAALQVGGRYLLFLSKSTGGRFTPAADQWTVLGAHQGALPVEDGLFGTAASVRTCSTCQPMQLSQLARFVQLTAGE